MSSWNTIITFGPGKYKHNCLRETGRIIQQREPRWHSRYRLHRVREWCSLCFHLTAANKVVCGWVIGSWPVRYLVWTPSVSSPVCACVCARVSTSGRLCVCDWCVWTDVLSSLQQWLLTGGLEDGIKHRGVSLSGWVIALITHTHTHT